MRRRLTFRLYTLFAGMALAAVFFAICTNGARRQRSAVEILRPYALDIRYDYEIERLEKPAYWPQWLIDTLGIDYFASVKWVSLARAAGAEFVEKAGVSDSEFASISAFQSLEMLDASETQVTDVGIESIAGLTGLKTLGLRDTRVTDKSVWIIKGFKSLERLDLGLTSITPGCIQALREMTSLRFLVIDHTKASNEELEIPNCEIIR